MAQIEAEAAAHVPCTEPQVLEDAAADDGEAAAAEAICRARHPAGKRRPAAGAHPGNTS